MKRPFIRAEFYETYYFATCARNILYDQFAYIRNLHDFYGDDAYLAFAIPFPRYSAFHCFLEFFIREILTADTESCDLDIRQDQMSQFKGISCALEDMRLDALPIEDALRFHGLAHVSFVDWLAAAQKTFGQALPDDVYEYLDSLRDDGVIDVLLEQAVKEAFYVLFGNRSLLMLFNQMMANRIKDAVIVEMDAEVGRFFERDGALRRVTVPEWVRRAVFYRDRGLCTACSRDLSGLLNIWSENQFDHIVPLAKGGLNDVTNIQLLCGDCNRRKSDGDAHTSSRYEDWYEIDP